ncbi:MAG: HAD family hydrolase [Opitutales bacterium]
MIPFPRLLVLDLDGTALGGGHEPYARFPDALSAWLDRLNAAGCRWGLNTTWSIPMQQELIAASAVTSRPACLVAEFGRRIGYDDGAGFREDPTWDQQTTDRLKALRREQMDALVARIGREVTTVDQQDHQHLFTVRVDPGQADALQEQVPVWQLAFPDLNLLAHPGGTLDVWPLFLSKGKGQEQVNQHLGLRPAQVAVAGDSPPDIGLMQPSVAGLCLAPENAVEAVQQQVRTRNGHVGTGIASAGVMDAFARAFPDWQG